jgi:Fic family protein
MWRPIEDLPSNWKSLINPHLPSLVSSWNEQRQRLENTHNFKLFMSKLRRQIAIETGIIEHLYTIDRGITFTLIEHGIQASLIPHGAVNKPVSQIIALINDQEKAIEHVFDVVGNQRDLSTFFIKQLHQLLTKNQPTTEAIDQFGRLGQVELLRGDWKKLPNNPTREDGSIHEYCPPEQVSSQMDQLIVWHLDHMRDGVSPEVEAAWLHHRFTQIHPFQDGNGRVARNLATLVFLKAGWFPLVVLGEQMEEKARDTYIKSLEKADEGDLAPLTTFFAGAQSNSFLRTLSLSAQVLTDHDNRQTALQALGQRYAQRKVENQEAVRNRLNAYSQSLIELAMQRLTGLKGDINQILSQASPTFRLDSSDETNDNYYRHQIIETAKTLNYYANLNTYRAWVRFSIRLEGIQTEFLFSFHGLGRDDQPTRASSASAWQRLPDDSGESMIPSNLTTISFEPFTFNQHDEGDKLNQRFNIWIEQVIVLAIDYLTRNI